MHQMDADKTHREKTRWELHQNVEQILEATLHKTASFQPLVTHLTNHSSKMNKT